MEKITVKIKKLRDGVKIPQKATGGSAGFDLCADLGEPTAIAPLERALIPTGLAMEIPAGYGGFCFARSGLAIKKGIALSNGVGVIDSDYRGEVKVGIINLSNEEYTVEPGERIAQMVIIKTEDIEILESDALEDTSRGSGGFGSTGAK